MQIRDLGLMADAVYSGVPSVPGYILIERRGAGSSLNGFQAAAFYGGGDYCISFRGTAQPVDAVADLKLGAGMNSNYFAQGEEFTRQFSGSRRIVLCGHSLGGGIAQVVANRTGYPMVTFNAPGVAVFASRNILQATAVMTTVRTAGMALSALRHPVQAMRDMGSAFNRVRGLNVCLEHDVVSRIGVHYGNVMRIPGTSANPLNEHRMTTMNEVLGKSTCAVANQRVFEL